MSHASNSFPIILRRARLNLADGPVQRVNSASTQTRLNPLSFIIGKTQTEIMHLPLLHFNDVYRVSKQKLQSGETIDVSQFARRVDGLRGAWPKETGGLLLFSGDLFSPSVESSVVLRICLLLTSR